MINVSLLEDKIVRDLSGVDLACRAVALHGEFARYQAYAVSAIHWTLRVAIALGQIFEEAFSRFEGSFADWLRATVGEDAEGRALLSEDTARRYRGLWKNRDKLFPADGSIGQCRTLTDAYIKCGLLNPPESTDSVAVGTAKPLFKLAFVAPSLPVDQWPPSERQAFLDRTAPIAKLRTEILQAAAA